MSRLWHGGAELNSVTDAMEVDTNSGTVVISSTTVRSGTYSWRANPSASTGFYRKQISGADQNKAGYLRLYVYITTLPGTTIQLLRFSSTANAHLASIRLTSTGTLTLNGANNTQIGSASTALSTGQWYMIELKCDATNATGTVDARLDGSSFASGNNSSRGSWARILWGAITPNSTCDIFFDDAALNDAAGSAQTSWPGSGKIICLRPNASGDSNQWLKTAGGAGDGSNYQLVDEVTPNDATDYIQSTTLNDVDAYNMGASGLSSGDTINVVTGHLRLANDSADATIAVKLGIMKTSGGTVTEGSAIIPNSTTWMTDGATATFLPTLITYTDPDTSAWTNTTLDSCQLRAKLTADTANKILISAMWLLVDYTPSSGTTYTKDLSDTVSIADTISKFPKKNLSDSMSMAEIFNKTPKLTKTDTVTLSDSIVKVATKILAESFGVSDSLTISVILQVLLADTQSITDGLSKVIKKNSSDIFSLADSLVKNGVVNLSENQSLADSISKSIQKAFLDTIVVSETISKTAKLTKVESLAVTDALYKVAIKTVNDSFFLADTIRKTIGLTRSEAITLADLIVKSVTLNKTDSLTIIEFLVNRANLNVSDAVQIADSINKINSKNLTELFTIADSTYKLASKYFTDSVTVNDSIESALQHIAERIYIPMADRYKRQRGLFSSSSGTGKKVDEYNNTDDKFKKKLY